MNQEQNNTSNPIPGPQDDQYKRGTKAVVDDAMRMDVLGPKVVTVLQKYTPAGNELKDQMLKNLKDEEIKEAIVKIVSVQQVTDTGKTTNKYKALIITGIIGTAVGVIVTWSVGKLLQP
ncbi:MAG TPA: hypothetical protein VD735_02045 [Candidatus Saccharimonadales bacterium]|nr:hypothetical protein [Candidatus Saccharimonadales bacterium]